MPRGDGCEPAGQCRTLLLRDNDPNRPSPTVTFEDHHTLTVGGQTLELAYHGPNHTPDNIFIWAPEQHTLMLVDIIFPRWVPWRNLAVSQDIPDWIKAQDIALSYPWQTLVAGHLGRLGTCSAPSASTPDQGSRLAGLHRAGRRQVAVTGRESGRPIPLLPTSCRDARRPVKLCGLA